MKKLFKDIAAVGLMIALLAGLTQASLTAAAVTFKVVETPAVSVYTSQGSTDTTLVVTPVPVDLDGNVLTMSNFGSNPTVTVDPGVSGYEEIESFSTITNNGNQTATLGGMTRDLQSVYPYTTAGAGKQHGGGAIVVFGNNPQVYGRLGALENDQLWTGLNTYSAAAKPAYNSAPTFGSGDGLALVNYATLLATAIQGAATSTEGNMGIVQLAPTGIVGVASSTTGAPYVLKAAIASTTYNGSTAFQGEIPALRSTKNIDPNFIATSSTDNYSFGGTVNIASSTVYNQNVGNLNATSSATLPVNTKIGGLPALNTSYVPVKYTLINTNSFNSSNNTNSGTTVGTSTDSLTIPAGVFAASSTITVFATSNSSQFCLVSGGGSATCTLYLRDSAGENLATCNIAGAGSLDGIVNMSIFNQNSTSAQRVLVSCMPIPATVANYVNSVGTNTINTSGTMTLFLASQIVNSGVGSVTNFQLNTFSIVVTP